MAIYGEPKDGDFVRYIETLNRQAGGTPGQVTASERLGILTKKWKKTDEKDDLRDVVNTYGAPLEESSATYSTGIAPGSTDNDNKESATLASRGAQGNLALILTIAAAVALWNAVSRLITMVKSNYYDLDQGVPILFLTMCAWMLFKASQNARRKKAQPLAKLPPLGTLEMGRNPKK